MSPLSDPGPLSPLDEILKEQIRYYGARAGEYDEWFLRRGRYDRGSASNQQWFDEIAELSTAIAQFKPNGNVLELACGTGLFTQRLAPHAETLTAVDAAPRVLQLNSERVRAPAIRYIRENLFTWRPERVYDVVFFSFWLSHVPPEKFDAFFELVDAALAPAGRVFFIDSLYSAYSTARDHELEGPAATTISRRLNDGREFRIVKVFYDPAELSKSLADRGWRISIATTSQFFFYGSGGGRGLNRI